MINSCSKLLYLFIYSFSFWEFTWLSDIGILKIQEQTPVRFYDCKQVLKASGQLPYLRQLQHQEAPLLSKLWTVSKFE